MIKLRQLRLLFSMLSLSIPLAAQTVPSGVAIDAKVAGIMAQTGAKGMAIAVIDHGKVVYVQPTVSAMPRATR